MAFVKSERRGRRIAQLFRESRGLGQVRACNVNEILSDATIEVADSKYPHPGYAAVLIRTQGGGAGIMIAPNQSRGRRRFSLAHELGHFYIPTHEQAGPMLKCADADLRARSTDSKKLEWEANDFAAELLMPQTLFAGDIRHKPVSCETVQQLASPDMYDVSRTAAAWRFIQVTREPCCLVASVGGKIDWVARSDSFEHRVPERQQPLGTGTIAAAIRRGESAGEKPEKVAAHEWLDLTAGNAVEGIELFESAFSIPSLDQTISLLWTPETDTETDD